MSVPFRWVLLHSPLTGPDVWEPVADVLRAGGAAVAVPDLMDAGPAAGPYWRQHATAAAAALGEPGLPAVVAAHSGAGPLLPAVRAVTPAPVAAYLFVDAGIPIPRASRLDLLVAEDAALAESLRRKLRAGGRFPEWHERDLTQLVPDAALRRRLVAGLRPRGWDFFTEALPASRGWPDAPCAYLQFSPAYDIPAEAARQRGWPVTILPAGHFHMLAAPAETARALITLAATVREEP